LVAERTEEQMTATEKEELIEKLREVRKYYACGWAETDQYGNCYGIHQTRAEKGLEELIGVLIEAVSNLPTVEMVTEDELNKMKGGIMPL